MRTSWILGAGGFLGKHLSDHLAASGAKVVGIGHGDPGAEQGQSPDVFAWQQGSISLDVLSKAAERYGMPDVIFHLAGGSLVGASVERPFEDFTKSVPSTASVLEWIRTFSPEVPLVFASSAAVYGNKHAAPICEDALARPCSPYGYHKYISELLIDSYSAGFGIKASILRLFSVYGVQLQKQLLWDLCTRCGQRPPEIRLQGTGDETRDWLWVQDAVVFLEGLGKLAQRGPLVVNGGTGLHVSVREIAEAVLHEWESPAKLFFSGRSRPGDPIHLVADTKRSVDLGLLPQMHWRDGVRQYVRWFKQTGRP